jgi:hypothetical protein
LLELIWRSITFHMLTLRMLKKVKRKMIKYILKLMRTISLN